MSIPRLGVEISATEIKVIWLTPRGKQKSIETIPLLADKDHRGTTYQPNLVLDRIRTIPDRFGFSGPWDACIAAEPSTFVLWNRADGKPVTPMLSWRDKRGHDWYKNSLPEQRRLINEHTGLPLTPGGHIPKLIYYLQKDEVRKPAENGELCLGNVGTWLLWQATEGELHWTDRSLALRSRMYNPESEQWDEKILAELDIPEAVLPEVGNNLEDKIKAGGIWNKGNIISLLARQEAYVIGSYPPPRNRTLVRMDTDGYVSGPDPEGNAPRWLSRTHLPCKGGDERRADGRIPAAGSTIDWLTKILGVNRATFNQWMAPPWPDNPPLWSASFYGSGPPSHELQTPRLMNFTEVTSTREISQGLLISLLLNVKRILKGIPGKKGEQSITLGGDLARLGNYPKLARTILEVPVAVNHSPMVTGRGAIIHSSRSFSYLTGDPWYSLVHETVMEKVEANVRDWEQAWKEKIVEQPVRENHGGER